MQYMVKGLLTSFLISLPGFTGLASFEKPAFSTCGDWIPISYQGSTLCVSPDYYSVDGVRTPVGMSEALDIAEQENALLPTPKMVDAIWEQADIKLSPITMTPGPEMTSVAYYQRHHAMIEEQLEGVDVQGLLIAGHKKDIVQQQVEGKVTIYGWHKSDGKPIQPVYSGHHDEYRDYSHGLRLVRWADSH
ncbi:MAG: hypothetical protein GVY35_05085 [Bacteroidetes bacterium]|jgi:hypothetical protein|nr:hypothetical protein [Bacteroidota bacterium]